MGDFKKALITSLRNMAKLHKANLTKDAYYLLSKMLRLLRQFLRNFLAMTISAKMPKGTPKGGFWHLIFLPSPLATFFLHGFSCFHLYLRKNHDY